MGFLQLGEIPDSAAIHRLAAGAIEKNRAA